MRKTTLVKVTSLITDGKHGNCKDEVNSGYYFLSAKDIRESLVYKDSREITKNIVELLISKGVPRGRINSKYNFVKSTISGCYLIL